MIYFFCNSGLDKNVFDGSASIFTGLLNHLPVDLKKKTTVLTTNISLAVLKKRLQKKNLRIIQFSSIGDKKPAIIAYPKILCHFFSNSIAKKSIDEALKQEKKIYLISGSDFWPDTLPAIYYKLKYPSNVSWIASFFLFAPKPWGKQSPYKGRKFFIGFLYWLTQRPIYYLIKKYADYVLVTSLPDVKRFITPKRGENRIIVIKGGIDIEPSKMYLDSGKIIPTNKRKYDACFVGRLHYQKGLLELVEIWKLVCQKKPQAKLAIIGIGPLENNLQEKIVKEGLGKNIELLGFKDGEEKYAIFKQSKIVVHPAIYDSGGMAACEAMAWGLPGVSFDLESLKSYYPKGMLKTDCFDLISFAANIVKLLDEGKYYQKISLDALSWAREWDWQKKTQEFLEKVKIDFS